MRKICYKGKFYEGNNCPTCGKNNISFYKAKEGWVTVCNDCKNWEWLEDAVDSSFLTQVI